MKKKKKSMYGCLGKMTMKEILKDLRDKTDRDFSKYGKKKKKSYLGALKGVKAKFKREEIDRFD